MDNRITSMVNNSFDVRTNPGTRVSPTVLGSNPTDVAKNMDIARRTA